MADGEIDYCQDFDRERNLIFPYTEQVINHTMGESVSQVGDELTEIVRIDANAVRIRVYDLSALSAFVDEDDQYTATPSAISFNVPPTLVSLTTSFNENKGNGQSNSGVTGNTSAVGASAHIAQNPRATASASAATLVDVLSVIRPNIADDVPAITYWFYRRGNVTANEVRAKVTRLAVTGATFTVTVASPGVLTSTLHGFSAGDEVVLTTTGALPTNLTSNTVIYFVKTVPTSDTLTLSLTAGGSSINTTGTQSGIHKIRRAIKTWPHWKPEQVQILCKSQEASIQQSAEVTSSVTATATEAAISWWLADGDATSRGASNKMITLPPTLHNTITISSTSLTSTITVDADAVSYAVVVDGTTWLTAKTSQPTQLSKTVVASITPTSVTATSGFTDVPTSGLYMRAPDGNLDIFDLVLYRVTVVDFAYFA